LTTALTIAGLVLAAAGVVGCILPVVPGPPLGFVALLVLSYAKHWKPFSPLFLTVMGGVTALVLFLDYALPAAGARRYGASRRGAWGSVVGMIVGLFVFPPFGLFIGCFLGAMAGELYAGRTGDEALRAGLGTLVGNLAATVLKMGVAGVMLFFYVKEMF